VVDNAPTGSVPVVDNAPTGSVPVVDFAPTGSVPVVDFAPTGSVPLVGSLFFSTQRFAYMEYYGILNVIVISEISLRGCFYA